MLISLSEKSVARFAWPCTYCPPRTASSRSATPIADPSMTLPTRHHRTDERARSGNRREVMPEDNPLVRLHEIFAIIVDFARRGASVVERENPGGDPLGIKAVADSVRAERGDEDVNRVDRFAPAGGQDGVSPRSEQRDHQPDEIFDGFVHRTLFLLDRCQQWIVRML